MSDHSDCNHPPNCLCGNPVAGEAHFPERPKNVEELMFCLNGGIIVQTFFVCDECMEFAIQVVEEIEELV